ncbi:hypothetical protein [Pseudomonas frederiksbergensis]|uniref:hypothetical protein n=1 Tax=Pseudomonas frederiksbergensis TaxID=104087 RepID=UPI001FE43DD4|nr:hypothetical protein [Pseudomonas frederiksbergensis]
MNCPLCGNTNALEDRSFGEDCAFIANRVVVSIEFHRPCMPWLKESLMTPSSLEPA